MTRLQLIVSLAIAASLVLFGLYSRQLPCSTVSGSNGEKIVTKKIRDWSTCEELQARLPGYDVTDANPATLRLKTMFGIGLGAIAFVGAAILLLRRSGNTSLKRYLLLSIILIVTALLTEGFYREYEFNVEQKQWKENLELPPGILLEDPSTDKFDSGANRSIALIFFVLFAGGAGVVWLTKSKHI